MFIVLIGVLAAGAALALYGFVERAGRTGLPLALLRGTSWGVVAALVADPGCARARAGAITVLLDGSRSMAAGGEARWHAAVDSARALAGRGGRIVLFGDEATRPFADTASPDLAATRLLPALREAAAAGGRLAIVTDGAVDDAAQLPPDVMARARVVVLPRAEASDAGIAAVDLPPALRAGDTATATVDVVVAGATARDSALLELTEQGRVVARARLHLGAGANLRQTLAFVPAPATEPVVRRYEARLSGWARDGEPRDDRLASAARVSPSSSIVLVSDQPDWDFRALGAALSRVGDAPVRTFVRTDASGWRDARTFRPVGEETVHGEMAAASLVVVHGTTGGVAALAPRVRHALWRWPADADRDAGDWYVTADADPSPVSDALTGIPADSLPPVQLARDLRADSTGWTALAARRDRRGAPAPLMAGADRGGRRTLDVAATGLWRWQSKGGVAAEAYRQLMAAAADWLLATRNTGAAVMALRDSLARGAGELLPRPAVLRAQPGRWADVTPERLPLRRSGWPYAAVVLALVLEWVARRRAGMR